MKDQILFSFCFILPLQMLPYLKTYRSITKNNHFRHSTNGGLGCHCPER